MAVQPSALGANPVKALARENSSSTTPTTTGMSEFSLSDKRKAENHVEYSSVSRPEKRLCSEIEKTSSGAIGVEPRAHRGMYKTPLRSDNELTSVEALVEEPCCDTFEKASEEHFEECDSSGRCRPSSSHDTNENTATNGRNEGLCKAATGQSDSSLKTNPNTDDHELLWVCIKNGSSKDLELALARVDPSTADFCVFELAIENGRANVVRILLEDERCKPNLRENAPLRLAARRGCVEIVKVLLQSEWVDPGDKNNEAIRVAAKTGNTEIVDALLHSGKVDPSAKNNEALRNAVRYGHEAVVKELMMDYRVDPNAVTYDLLKAAREAGHKTIVDAILFDRRARSTIEVNKGPKRLMNDEQRRRLKRLNRLRKELDSDVDHEFLERFEAHLLRVLLIGSVEELCVASLDRKVTDSGETSGDENEDEGLHICWDSSDSEGNRNEKVDDRKLQQVFQKNLKESLPRHLQRLLRSTNATFQRYKKLFQNYNRSERLQYLLEWKFNFHGDADKDLVHSGFRPSAMKIGEVKSFPEMSLFVKNTRLEFVAKQLGKLFSERTCKTDKPSLSHAECVAVFRVLMCIYSAGSNKFVYHVDMYKEVARFIAWSIKCKLQLSQAVLAERLERLQGKSFSLTYKEAMKELRI